MKKLFVLVPCLLASACAFVKPSAESQVVALRDAAYVTDCQKMGSTTSKTLQKMWVMSRADKKVFNELVMLAKNEAVIMGGNTVVAESKIDKGQQIFGVYSCTK